jgi:hypothetical protein
MRRLPHRVLALACLPALALGAVACGTTTSTSDFHGAEREAAQTVADLQSDVTSGERKKICERDLAAPVVTRLGGRARCETVVKNRLAEIDNTEIKIESVKVSGSTATATVKSTYSGNKSARWTVALAKEGSRWKITGISRLGG